MRGRGLAGVVLLLAALTACTGDDDRPVGTVDATYALDGRLTCDSEVKEAPGLPLGAEPTAMLICADPASMVPWTAPIDVVEQDLSRLADAIADLEPAPDEPFDCTFDGGVGFDLVLRLPADRAVRLHGDTGGCSLVETGNGDWLGGDEFFATVLEMVQSQRATTGAPATLAAELRQAPDCPDTSGMGPPYSLVGDVADLAVAVSCWRPDAKELQPYRPAVRLHRKDLRALLRDMEVNSAPSKVAGAGYDCPGGLDNLYFQTVIGRTTRGDLVAVDGWCREFQVRRPWTQQEEQPLLWHPSPRAQRVLDDLRR